MDVEEALKRAGHFGPFQKRLLSMICLLQFVTCAVILSITFVGMPLDWHCSAEEVTTAGAITTSSHWSVKKRCHYFGDSNKNCTPVYEEGFHSIAKEWDLICDRTKLINLTQSGFFLGFLIGTLILGRLADSIGRRKVVIMFFISLPTLSILTALSPNVSIFFLCRFGIGFASSGFITFYVLVSEVLGASYRGLLSVLVAFLFALGFVTLSTAAYLLYNWRNIFVLISLMALPFLVSYRNIPESPLWLLSVGNEAKAKRAILNIARANSQPLSTDFTLKHETNQAISAGLLDLLQHKILFKRTLLLSYCWFTVCMVYYGLSLGVGNLSSSLYVSFSLSGLVEIPSYLIAYFTLDKLGRRWSNVLFLTFGGLAAIGCAFVQFTHIDSNGNVQMALALAGKFSISAAFCVVFAYTPELYSTDVRNLGMAICNVLARFGGILAPVIILLDTVTSAGISMLLMGLLATVSGVLSLGLPETLNCPLPNTINDIR